MPRIAYACPNYQNIDKGKYSNGNNKDTNKNS